MFRLVQPKENAVLATYQYLKAIGAKVSEETVEETLKNHPDYPSLLATSDALNEWNVENVAVKITPEQLLEIPTPFLAYLNSNGGIFALIKSIKNNKIEWIHTIKGTQRESIEDFNKKWNGVVLIAEANENSIEKNYAENHQKEIIKNLRTPILMIGCAVLIISLLYKNFTSDWQYNALLLTKLLGTIISCLLLWQSIDKNNPFIKALCKSPTQSGRAGEGCSSILNSKAAQITPWLNWSEVGFFYFAGGFVALLISSDTKFPLWGLGGLAIFYTLYSLYYQGFIARQWCTLCLAIQAVILIEFGLSIGVISNFNFPLGLGAISFSPLGSGALAFGTVILFWIFLKPILQKSQQVTPLKNNLRRFKNNPELFLSLLEKQDQMPYVANYLQPVMIGNPEAEHTITMVTNPFCQPCAKTHQTIEKLLENNENLNCQVIFAASNNENDKRGIVSRSILSLPIEKQANALHEWYNNEDRNIEKWQKQFEIIENKSPKKIIEQHQYWCDEAKIEGTPTLYLDGFKMPELYRLEDLKSVLKYLPIRIFENHK